MSHCAFLGDKIPFCFGVLLFLCPYVCVYFRKGNSLYSLFSISLLWEPTRTHSLCKVPLCSTSHPPMHIQHPSSTNWAPRCVLAAGALLRVKKWEEEKCMGLGCQWGGGGEKKAAEGKGRKDVFILCPSSLTLSPSIWPKSSVDAGRKAQRCMGQLRFLFQTAFLTEKCFREEVRATVSKHRDYFGSLGCEECSPHPPALLEGIWELPYPWVLVGLHHFPSPFAFCFSWMFQVLTSSTIKDHMRL